ncbi:MULTISPECIES: DUF6153 family protein [Microbacterium]|uniref:DUF6153 family protein n=1 Tax=Microbacterium TaxID=33882 RepID=UPI00051A1D93|nr:DUF6153 family protein [Microbacterium profundi]MCE7480671.1 DUF6153 family protein [Microbacterium profundi]
MLLNVETVTDEPCRRPHWLQLTVLAILLIAGLLAMHALINGAAATATIAPMATMGHASQTTPGTSDDAATTPTSTATGPHGMVHRSGGCAAAMGSGVGSTCTPGPTDKSIPVLPVPLAAVLPDLGPAAEPGPPLETARRLALSHLELSISRT